MEITCTGDQILLNGVDITAEVMALKALTQAVEEWNACDSWKIISNGVEWAHSASRAYMLEEVRRLRSIGVENITVERKFEYLKTDWRKVEV